MTLSIKHLSILFSLSLSLGACSTLQSPVSSSNFETPSSRRAPSNVLPEKKTGTETSVASSSSPGFDWPVDNARMTRGFLPHKRKPHLGLDLAAPKGTPIMASKAGTVIYAGREFHGYGKMILVESGEGWAALYAHLDKILVKEGKVVRQGEVIGAMGRTGHATGVHLHFEIRKDRGPVDPLPLLPQVDKLARQ